MNTIPVQLKQQSKLLQDYRDRKESIFTQFEYDPYAIKSYENRLSTIQQLDYKRDELVDVLLEQNKRWGQNPEAKKNIEKLRSEDASVIIGGQQAGLLTGPLYTIHKIISILIHAKEENEHLQKPVIPVFWIAGEDHDFEEINHVYVEQEASRFKKVMIQDDLESKQSVSDRTLPKEEAHSFVENVFQHFQETKYTKDLLARFKEAIDVSENYVDFFGRLIHQMFPEEGLVLVDSDDTDLRKLEAEYMVKLIEHQPEISKAVVDDLTVQEEKGYRIALDVALEDGHLFYHLDGERLLLIRQSDHQWVSKEGEVAFSHSEMIEEAKQFPEKFSNNVVTRPIMQELVFPVLAFHAGPGELAYWSVLKNAFRCLNLTLPIVMPRMSVTLLQANHQSWAEELNIPENELVQSGTYQHKMQWLKRKTKHPIEETVEEVKKQLYTIHEPIREIAKSISPDMEKLSHTNSEKLAKELDFIEKKFLQAVTQEHQQKISQYDALDLFYHPSGGLQERVWNIAYWMNQYGLDLPSRLAGLPPKWEQDHLLVEL